jgi:hypothetical protein
LLAILGLLLTVRGVDACIAPSSLVRSTVSITRTFDGEETRLAPDVVGIRGTGWFLSPRLLVTAEHVSSAMRLSGNAWKEIEVRERDSTRSIPARVQGVAGAHAEKIAVLELQAPFPGAAALQLRMEPLVPEEPLASLAYPLGRLRVAGGRFVEYSEGDRFSGAALLEMYDGNDRLVLDHGASGAPVLDCEGRVVAVVSTAITQTITFMSPAVRTSTAWQTPNVISMPIQALRGFPRAE